MRGCVNRINNVAYTMQYVIGINIRWTLYDRWSAHNLINNNNCNYLLLSLVINSTALRRSPHSNLEVMKDSASESKVPYEILSDNPKA